MDDSEHAQMKLQEDKKRIADEIRKLEEECARIDGELAEAVKDRKQQEGTRAPLAAQVEAGLLARYERVRRARTPAVVPLVETNKQAEACGGCYMTIRPQVVNEIMAAKEYHSCSHCSRILYYPGNIEEVTNFEEY